MTERVRCNPELVCIYGFGQVSFWINQWRFGQVCFCDATWWAQLLFRFRFFMGFYLGPSIGQCSHLYQRKKITITSQSQPSKSGWNLRPILGDQILRISQFFLVDKEATEGKKVKTATESNQRVSLRQNNWHTLESQPESRPTRKSNRELARAARRLSRAVVLGALNTANPPSPVRVRLPVPAEAQGSSNVQANQPGIGPASLWK